MANVNETAVASVTLDGAAAGEQIKQLKKQAAELRKELKEMKIAGDKTGYENKKRELDEITKKTDQAKRSTWDLQQVMKNLNGTNLKDLERAQRQLTNEVRNATRATLEDKKALQEKTRQLQLIKTEIQKVKVETGLASNSNKSLFSSMSDGFNKYFGIVTAFAASFTGIILGFRKLIDMSNQYGESVANLSALTGLAGKDLEWLSNKAKEVAKNGTDAGIKVTAGAQAIVDAYTLMGSAKPELLKNKEALDLVTQSALIMADAAKITATEAVDSLANTMNQFGANASEASRYINVLAAGSKEGAAAIPSISASMVKFGAAAATANVSVEESVGLIETLAEKGLKGELAGTQIKTALIKMQSGADDTNPSIVGLVTALENLRAKNLSTTEMVKFFGQEAYIAGQILVSGSERVKYFTDAVTGTSVALEQAAINTDTNAAALQRARNNYELTAIALGEKLAPALTFSTNGFTYFMKAIMAAPEFFRKNEVAIIAFVGAVLALNAAKIKSAAAMALEHLMLQKGIGLRIKDAIQLQLMIIKEEIHAAMIVKTTIAQKGAAAAAVILRNAMALLGGPIGIVILGITALVAGMSYYEKNSRSAIARQRELKTAFDNVNEAITSLRSIQEKYNNQISDLNKLSITEKNDLKEKIRLSIEHTKAKILELKAKSADLEESNRTVGMWQEMSNSLKSWGHPLQKMYLDNLSASINGRKAVEPYQAKIGELDSQLKQLENTSSSLGETLEAESIADKIGTKTITELEEKIKYLGVALKNVAIDSEDYKRIQDKLSVANKQLQKATKDLSTESGSSEDKNKKLKTSYEKLSEAIGEAKKKMLDFIAAGKYPEAKQAGALLKSLELQQNIANKIAEAGGDINKFLNDLTDDTQGLLDEIGEVDEKLMNQEWFKKSVEKYKTSESEKESNKQQFRTNIITDEYETTTKKNEDNKFGKDDYLSAIETTSSAAFDIWKAQTDARLEYELNALNTQMEKELSNKNLTEAQKDKIRVKYANKERQLKQEAWKKQRDADIIQAIINTALAVTRAMAGPGSLPAAILAGIAGAAQVATIAAQPMPQFSGGGATGKGMGMRDQYGQVAGIVHADEYVIPEWMRSIPQVISFERVMEGIRTGRSFAAGGSTSAANSTTIYNQHTVAPADQSLQSAIETLNAILARGVNTKLSLFDLEEYQQKKEDIESISAF
jgi:TP901 family phage tail tape measure protein